MTLSEDHAHPLRVTFDTNTIDRVSRPELFPKDPRQSDFFKIHAALLSGKILGYFSETLLTLEAVTNDDRVEVFGSTRIETSSKSSRPNAITLTIAIQQDRKPLHPGFADRIGAARKIGMKALRGVPRIGGFRAQDADGSLFEDNRENLTQWVDRIVEIAQAIEDRGLGYSIAQALGLQLNEFRSRAGELWISGLGLAKGTPAESQVEKAIAEWADGDSIATHIAYGIDIFCTEDQGHSTGGQPSIFDKTNRSWLSDNYNAKFVTLVELAALL